MRYAVIIAGGSGTRLWPLSRKSRPKQLLRILGNKSLLELSLTRLRGLIEPANTFIMTNAEYAQAVRDEAPDVPAENVIGEPQGRDTANAIGLAAAILNQRDPEAVMGVFTADHIIEPVEAFGHSVTRAFDLADRLPQSLITFGLKPAWPHTGLGYIHGGEIITTPADDYEALKVQGFKEKPSHEVACTYCKSGRHFWNSGMFVWQAKTILAQLQEFLPGSYEGLQQIAAQWDSPAGLEPLERIFPTLEKISIDYAVMEKADNVLVVVLPCSWVDVGSWSTLTEVMPADGQGNITVASVAELLDSRNNIIVSEDDHLLALVGLQDLVVVHSPDATLICHKEQAQLVRSLVAKLEKQGEGRV